MSEKILCVYFPLLDAFRGNLCAYYALLILMFLFLPHGFIKILFKSLSEQQDVIARCERALKNRIDNQLFFGIRGYLLVFYEIIFMIVFMQRMLHLDR